MFIPTGAFDANGEQKKWIGCGVVGIYIDTPGICIERNQKWVLKDNYECGNESYPQTCHTTVVRISICSAHTNGESYSADKKCVRPRSHAELGCVGPRGVDVAGCCKHDATHPVLGFTTW